MLNCGKNSGVYIDTVSNECIDDYKNQIPPEWSVVYINKQGKYRINGRQKNCQAQYKEWLFGSYKEF